MNSYTYIIWAVIEDGVHKMCKIYILRFSKVCEGVFM
jgi:hypothetical protein